MASPITRVFFLLFLSALLSACGSQEPAPSVETTPQEEALPPDPNAIVLDIFHPFSVGASIQPELERQGHRFVRQNPQYRIKWTWGGSESTQRLRARLNAADPPDAALNADAFLVTMARQGVAQPLDAYLEEQNYEGDSRWLDTFWPGLLHNSHVADGADGAHFYGIPWSAHVSGIYYNKGFFERQGYAVPATWKQLVDLCQTMRDQVRMPCFEADNFNGYNARLFFYIATRYLGNDVLYNTATNRPGTSWQGFVKVAQMTQDFVTRFYTRGWEGNRWPVGQMDWANEGAAMIIMPTWLPSELREIKAEGFVMDLFPFPKMEGAAGNPTVSEIKFNGWFIPKGAKNPEGAIELIKFLSSRQAQGENVKSGGVPPAIQGVPLPEGVEGARSILAGDGGMPFAAGLDADAADWLQTVFYPLNDQLMLGQLTPAQFIAQLQEEHDAFYAAKESGPLGGQL